MMVDVALFALDNTIVTMGDGTLLKQMGGIPMGDPISPGEMVGVLHWMEQDWLQGLSAWDKQHFKARRYMDDVLLCFAKSASWDHERFLADFARSECYHEPLKLEDGKPGTFLETTFRWEGERFSHKLKNDNRAGEEPAVWRYADFRSHASYGQKRALLTMMMRKVHAAASDRGALIESALQKLKEFRRLRYPEGLLRGCANFMGATTGEGAWIAVRNALGSSSEEHFTTR